MDDLLNEFLTETSESIEEVDVQLVELEQDPNNKGVLDNIFRLVHTIKGTCGFLGLPRLEKVAHAAENVLGKFRDGELMVTSDSVTVILESLDRIKSILADLEQTEEEPAGDDSALIASLDSIITSGGKVVKVEPDTAAAPAAVAPVAAPAPAAAKDMPDIIVADREEDLRPGEVSMAELEAAFASAPGPDEEEEEAVTSLFDKCGGADSISVASHLISNRLENSKTLSEFFEKGLKERFNGMLTAILQGSDESAVNIANACICSGGFGADQFDNLVEELRNVLKEVGVSPEVIEEVTPEFDLIRDGMVAKSQELANSSVDKGKEKAGAAASGSGTTGGGRTQSIRVNVDLLEDLMNMVSELVLTRNQLMQMLRQADESEFAVPLQRLSQCTTELQEGVMKTRMQQIGNAWAKLPRIVRDLSVDLDKKIELVMNGAETELDRQVLELIKDPLTHMVRNSADHGVEMPAERLAMGKPEKGTITLNAYHEGGHIIVQIIDDGKGLPVAKLRKKALEREIASVAEIEAMSDNQIQKLIFHPGFSTAEKVTNVSGRGVGMDVVRTNIEKIGGTIDMDSVEGRGTSLSIKIPLTLAIVSGMIVEATGQRFAIPQISVLELVRASSRTEYAIEKIKDTPVLRLRNSLLPLVFLNEALGYASVEAHSDEALKSDQFIVVTQVGSFTFGIVVDQVFDTEEIVVKPVAPLLKDMALYSGNTILGDGTVIMILDPNGISELANANVSNAETANNQDQQSSVVDQNETILIFHAGSSNQKAVPLSLVARLEDIEVERIEKTDVHSVVQYRGSLMPLVVMNEDCHIKETGRQPVIVFTDGDRTMGLAVDEIVDIIEDRLEVELTSSSAGIVGSGVIAKKATEMIDVAHYMDMAFADRREEKASQQTARVSDVSVLLIDDSSFFRNMLKPLLSSTGYAVTTASNASEALKLRESGKTYDLIISDIEMPGMSGFELAESIKGDDRWKSTPLVALTNLTSEKDFDRGREAGFNDYVPKFDRDALLHTLSQQLKIKEDAA
jgi:two-component system chemotaxis sensor kinase CheA